MVALTRLREACRPLAEHLGSCVPAGITAGSLSGYRAFRSHCSPHTIRKELQTLRAALRWAERQGWYDKAPQIDLGGTPPPRDRWLSETEQATLIAAATGHLRTFIIVALHTGARKSAILGLKWSAVDFQAGTIDFNDPDRLETKKRRAVVPINRTLRDELERICPLAQCDYVIDWGWRRVGDIKNGFARAVRRAGLVGVSPHVLKHSFVSNLAARGVQVYTIADLSAYRRATIRRVDRKSDPASLRDVVELLDDSVESCSRLTG